ncbi:MAG: magnesium transporter CorA family protein [Clostridia bacterium]|jgi:magnesium transporter|nr:magnesium transporter CorA family protein [Clostridia bacterium]NLS84639.1 magnesium transporter CorA family protein [Oscillospiraceae bacterium]
MVNFFLSDHGILNEVDTLVAGAWVNMCAPTEEELATVGAQLDIDPGLLRAALDEEERSRIDFEDGHTLILVDTPTVEVQQGRGFEYSTIPFGIILTESNIVTVCLKESALSRAFSDSPVKNFSTKKKNRMTLQLLYRNATLFLYYLREIDKAKNRVENELHISMKNKELIQMLGLEKSLVYFSTSLKGNETVLEKLMRMDFVKNYPDDAELLEDVIIENKQAIEMSTIYRDILSGTMDAFASVISNNLNIVMKALAAVTIILTIPTIVFGLWGTNVPLPFEANPFGFWIVIAIATALTVGATVLMVRKKWL